jgi:nicotinate-nucleotide pyrophosphorylase (carboxylating)
MDIYSVAQTMTESRQERLRYALFRGAGLTLANPDYLKMVRTFTEELLRVDREPLDLTCAALALPESRGRARMISNESGVLAGLDEAVWYFTHFGIAAERSGADGQTLEPGQVFLELEGNANLLLSLERVGLNLLQRMSGIATATRRMQDKIRKRGLHAPPNANVVATRKTPWGLLDKRAAHLGGGGTHRLGLGDAILIKTNHLRLFAPDEAQAIPMALNRAWSERHRAAFIEVEVTSLAGALAAGKAFRALRRTDAKSNSYPCLIMLDNRTVDEVSRIIASLKTEEVWDDVLIEVSGGISDETVEVYADCGVDAISVGALTHSCRALDLRCRLEIGAGAKAPVKARPVAARKK